MHGHSLDDKVKEVQLVHPPIIFTHARTHTRTSSHTLEHLSHALKRPLLFRPCARAHTHAGVEGPRGIMFVGQGIGLLSLCASTHPWTLARVGGHARRCFTLVWQSFKTKLQGSEEAQKHLAETQGFDARLTHTKKIEATVGTPSDLKSPDENACVTPMSPSLRFFNRCWCLGVGVATKSQRDSCVYIS